MCPRIVEGAQLSEAVGPLERGVDVAEAVHEAELVGPARRCTGRR
ncbi:MAG: hypothetical protein U5R31_03560 [Acidimicrobiia bacterium]|nr:hypothetical protein [Acidimicrobiia bacterium]